MPPLFGGPAAGSDSDLVIASGAWTATANVSWLHATASGTNNGRATFTFDANTQWLARQRTISANRDVRNQSLAYKKIPFLGDLPVLGWLFKNRRENDDRTEILVFITPKITNRALLRCK